MSVSSILLAMGLQYDYMDGGDVAEPGSKQIIEPVNALIEQYDFVIICLDFRWVSLRENIVDHWELSSHAIAETGGAKLIPGIRLRKKPEHVKFAHMGWFDTSLSAMDAFVYNYMKHFMRTPYGDDDTVGRLVSQVNPKTLGICGLPLGCIKATCKDARARFGDMNLLVHADAIYGSQKEQVLASLNGLM